MSILPRALEGVCTLLSLPDPGSDRLAPPLPGLLDAGPDRLGEPSAALRIDARGVTGVAPCGVRATPVAKGLREAAPVESAARRGGVRCRRRRSWWRSMGGRCRREALGGEVEAVACLQAVLVARESGARALCLGGFFFREGVPHGLGEADQGRSLREEVGGW
jgi:hypothetical protein